RLPFQRFSSARLRRSSSNLATTTSFCFSNSICRSGKGNSPKPLDDNGIVAWIAESPSKQPVTHQRPGQKISDPQSGFQLQLIPVDLNRVPPILLQTFFVVAEVGQISEAARRLHLSQPAVTGHIRRLEA